MLLVSSISCNNVVRLNSINLFILHISERHDSDWWFVKKNLTEEKGWVPSQYLMDVVRYNHYVQKKLNEKIDKLPVFESKFSSKVNTESCN